MWACNSLVLFLWHHLLATNLPQTFLRFLSGLMETKFTKDSNFLKSLNKETKVMWIYPVCPYLLKYLTSYIHIRLIHYSFYCTYQPRHLTRVSQLYVKWFGTKERSVRANWATRLLVTPLPSKINTKKIENEKVCFQTQNFIWGNLKPHKWIPG